MAEMIGVAAAKTATEPLFTVAKKEIGYMWNSSKNVKKFEDEVDNLRDRRGRVQQLMSEAKGNKLLYGVKDWEKKAGIEISNAEEFLQEAANAKKTCCKIGVCGNWGTLHRYGKSAKKMAPSLRQLHERGSSYEKGVIVETSAPGPLDVYENKYLDDLQTHKLALGKIIKSLEDETIQITGIYGMGGVGKTTLAKEAVSKVKHLFAHVDFRTVSQTVNDEKIKKDIENATKIIDQGEKVLIILDDVWEKLILEKLCIPIKRANCKILLTSRSEKVCQNMNAQSIICVETLPPSEACNLFKRVVGEKVETNKDLKEVASKVVEECGGLPLLIQAVGNALKDESIDSWGSALTQLQKHAPMDIDDEIRKSFIQLQLSYDYLKSEEAKSCFLLCSLFPEDHDISLEELVFYGVGLKKFDDRDSVEDARRKVQIAVNTLTSSCLLLSSPRKGCTKMHDVIRKVALLIASQGNNNFLVEAGKGLKEWLPRYNSLESYTGISLMHNKIIKLPHYKVNVPKLEIFLVFGNRDLSMISDEFIKCMESLKVLDISLMNNISTLSQSLEFLKNLRTLVLRGNRSIQEISILGGLGDLEILILNETGIQEIPKEIAKLVNLRVLEVKDCRFLSRIAESVISALSNLEELCIDLSRVRERVIDCTAEVMKLSKLTYLDLTVGSFDLIPQGFNPENLKGFVIQIGDLYRRNELSELRRSDRYLIITNNDLAIPLLGWLKKLIEVSRPHIILGRIENLNNIMPTLYNEGFNRSEHIRLNDCANVSCLVDDSTKPREDEKFFKELKHLELWSLKNLVVIWKCPHEYISLTNLLSLNIYNCHKLERVLIVGVVQHLVNLRELDIQGCNGLKEVIWGGDDQSGNVIVLPSLATISLYFLPKLKRFFNSAGTGNCSVEYPSLVEVKIRGCGMEIWGPGSHGTPNLKTLVVNNGVPIVLDGAFAINEAVERSSRK